MADPYEHVYEAELLLSLAGDPETRSEMFLAAQTRAILALVRIQSPEPPKPGDNPIPSPVMDIWQRYGISEAKGLLGVRMMVQNVPDWDQQKIHAIKELRSTSSIGLKEAKDIVERMAMDVLLNPWW